jgi:Zn-dependent protease
VSVQGPPGVVGDVVILTPALGTAVAVPRSRWLATCDLLAELRALPPELLRALRTGADAHVDPEAAREIAHVVDRELVFGDHAADDAAGLTRLRDFCERSQGFFVGPPAPPKAAPAEPPAWHAKAKKTLGPVGVVLVVIAKTLAKFKAILFLLPKLKFAGSLFSAIITIGIYALFFGWPFALLFVLLLFVHEMGHVIVAKREGVSATAPMFVPFLGAAIALRELPKTAWVEAKIGLAGPVLGSVGAVVLYAIGRAEHSPLVMAAAYFGFFLNLLNLMPITPLDGGRAAAALHPYVWFLGIGGLALVFFRWPNFIIGLILLLGGMDAYRRLRAFREGGEEVKQYYAVRPLQRVAVAVVYFALIGALVYAMAKSYVPRPQ